MADRSRTLEFAFVTKQDRFDLTKSADELDTVADQASRTGQAMGAMAKDADSAADRFTASTKAIERSSDKAADAVKSDAHRAGRALDDFKGEAGSSGREAAASFGGGFSDVTGFVQETAANAFGGLGKLGAGAGLAAAVGIGIISSAAEKAAEKLTALRGRLLDLKVEGLDTTANQVKAILDQMRDDGDLQRFAEAARTAGIDWGDYVRALANGGPEADRMKTRLEELTGAWGGLATISGSGAAAHDLIGRLSDQQIATEGATIEAEALAIAQGNVATTATTAAPAVAELGASYQAMSEDLAAVKASIVDVGDASSALAADVAKDGKITAAGILKALQDTAAAQAQYKSDLAKVLAEGGADFAAWVAEQGPEVARGYITGSRSQRAAIRAAFNANVGTPAGEGITAGLKSQTPAATAQAARMHAEIAAAVGGTIPAPTIDWGPARRAAAAQARRIHAEIADAMNQPVSTAGRYVP